MLLTKSPMLNDVTGLMLWYAKLRWKEKPDHLPESFPCIAILAHSGNISSERDNNADEGITYVYLDDLALIKVSYKTFMAVKRKMAKKTIKRAGKRSKTKPKARKVRNG